MTNAHKELFEEARASLDAELQHQLAFREFAFRVAAYTGDEDSELISLLSQAMCAYKNNLSDAQKRGVVAWFSAAYAAN